MITEDKITEIFCIADDFCKELEKEFAKKVLPDSDNAPKRHRKRMMSDAEVITILQTLGSRGDYNPHTIPQQGIQMPQTLLYAVCVQAYATPVSANRII